MFIRLFKPSNSQSTSTLLLISLLVIVPLSVGLTVQVTNTVTETTSTKEGISDQFDQFDQFDQSAEMDKIADLDFSTQPEISKELQSDITTTMSGFNAGFRENPNLASDAQYLLSSSQLDMRFSESSIQVRIPNYQSMQKETNEIGNSDQRIDYDPDINPSENLLIDTMGQPMAPKLIGYTIATLEFVGSNQVEPIAQSPSASYFNYFYGSDPDKWISNVPSYQKLVYKDLYDNIDLVYTLKEGQLKYDFYVFPGGNYDDIQLRWDGPVSLQQSQEGLEIRISTLFSEQSLVDSNPINFVGTDRDETVLGAFRVIAGNTYGFSMDKYDQSKLLIIDPILQFSTFLGGSAYDSGSSLAVDGNGDIYITGSTSDAATDFPTTPSAYDETHNGGGSFGYDVFVSKLAANGSALLYSTFLGGSGDDYGRSLAIDAYGNVYITGETNDDVTDFPITQGAFDETHNGGRDAFVIKLAANGSKLLFSTFLGGSADDTGYSLAVDDNGDVYITGDTWDATTDYPTTNGTYDQTHNGIVDAFVTKLAANGSILLFSTFLGSSGYDYGRSLAIDSNGDIYITGDTWGATTGFPTTPGAYNETNNGATDVFVTKLAANGSTLLFSTFLGGSSNELSKSLAVDGNGDVYITGFTNSLYFPTTPRAYDETYNGGSDVFVSKLAANGSTLLFSTFLGGSGTDYGSSLTVDGNGEVYITGFTIDDTMNFPTTFGAFDETHNGGRDAFVTKLAANGSTLLYSTFLGGSDSDNGYSLAVDGNGDVYITGSTGSFYFPTSPSAYDYTYNGGGDVFLSKVVLRPSAPFNIISITKISEDDSYIFLFWYEPIDSGLVTNSYNVYRGTTSGSYTYLGSSPETYFYDSSVIEDQPYYYVVTTINTLGESIFSSEYYIILQSPSEPTAPQNVLTASGESFVELSWNPPLDDGGSAIKEYKIYRGTSVGSYSLVIVTSLTQFNDTFVDGGTTYYYTITAVNAVGESAYSTEVSATVIAPAGPNAPSLPTNLQITAGVEYVYLTWNAPTDNGGSAIVEYRVYRGDVSGNYDLILLTTTSSLNDTFVYGGTTYYYTVVAVNAVGESQYSNEAFALPEARSPSIFLMTTMTSLDPASSIELSINTSRFSYLDTVLISWDGSDDTVLSYPWAVIAPDTPGSHSLRVYANTTAGSETIETFSFSIIRKELTKPTIIYPNGGDIVSGTITIMWELVVDPRGLDISYAVFYSADNGTKWNEITTNLSTTQYDWDTTAVGDGVANLIKVVATNSNGDTIEDRSDLPFTILNDPSESSLTGTQIVFIIATFGVAAGVAMIIRIQRARR